MWNAISRIHWKFLGTTFCNPAKNAVGRYQVLIFVRCLLEIKPSFLLY